MYGVMGEAMENREAVERVVHEHGRWVLGAVRRRVGDAELAEDVAQGVFLLYWRKGAVVEGMSGEGKLAGWLYRAVRYCSANAMRLKRIRQRHEREAAMERKQGERTAGWMEVEGELEGAMDGLSEKDRQAVVLRFYRGLSLSEVGQAMGIEEEAAKKRVQRAVGKLREKLAGKGVEVEAGSLGAMVLAHAVEGVEGGVAGLVEKVMAGIGGGGGNGTAGMIAQGAAKMMVLAKVKVAAVVMGIVTAGAAVVGVGIQSLAHGQGLMQASRIQVLLPDGKPAVGAAVYEVKTDGPYVRDPVAGLHERGPTSRPGAGAPQTDANGQFAIPWSWSSSQGLGIVHDDGFAAISTKALQGDRPQVHLER